VKVLLDENFPLPLLAALRSAGVDADHIISLNLRGVTDRRIREMLRADHLLFLTQDLEFLSESASTSVIVVSRVRQSRPLAERLSVWMQGMETLLHGEPVERLFELHDDGRLVPWRRVAGSE
jgi:hypothetical protein